MGRDGSGGAAEQGSRKLPWSMLCDCVRWRRLASWFQSLCGPIAHLMDAHCGISTRSWLQRILRYNLANLNWLHILVAPAFQQLRTKLLQTSMCWFLCGHQFSIFWVNTMEDDCGIIWNHGQASPPSCTRFTQVGKDLPSVCNWGGHHSSCKRLLLSLD